MFLSRVIVTNYRCLKRVDVPLNAGLNVIVGNNECGKSTLLEAGYLASLLTAQWAPHPVRASSSSLQRRGRRGVHSRFGGEGAHRSADHFDRAVL